ncbi:MAG: multiheme c-type cytochrome [Armatimonadota bacterium]
MSQMRYDAVGVGMNDLRLRDKFFSALEAKKINVLDAGPSAEKTAKSYIVKVVDGVKIGIVSFGVTPTEDDEYQVRKAWYSAYKSARDASDILIVLDQSGTIDKDWLMRNTSRFGAPDIVIGGLANMSKGQPEIVGRTFLCPTSIQGKCIGVADVDFVKGQDPKISIRKMPLGTNYAEDGAVLKLVKAERDQTVKKIGQSADSQVLTEPVVSGKALPPADRRPYYPPQLCKTCHVQEYEDWLKTGHARALRTLVDAKRTVPECLTCHSEMYRRLGQWVDKEDGSAGVECATCHLDSLPHGLERLNVKKKTKVSPTLCLSCHTKERSPEYDEKTYFPKMAHAVSSASAK